MSWWCLAHQRHGSNWHPSNMFLLKTGSMASNAEHYWNAISSLLTSLLWTSLYPLPLTRGKFSRYCCQIHAAFNFIAKLLFFPTSHVVIRLLFPDIVILASYLMDHSNLIINISYSHISNISGTLVGNNIVDHSDVVGASPVGAAPTTSSFST